MTSTTIDRGYAVRCLLMLAALEDDAGGAGYAEGVADRLRTQRFAVDPEYIARIARHVEQRLPLVAGVECDGLKVRVTFADGKRGSSIRMPDPSVAADVAAALAGVSAS